MSMENRRPLKPQQSLQDLGGQKKIQSALEIFSGISCSKLYPIEAINFMAPPFSRAFGGTSWR